jgi:hypothetical protein
MSAELTVPDTDLHQKKQKKLKDITKILARKSQANVLDTKMLQTVSDEEESRQIPTPLVEQLPSHPTFSPDIPASPELPSMRSSNKSELMKQLESVAFQ